MQIDAVVTWVDGKDPLHIAKVAFYRRPAGGQLTYHEEATAETRFTECGELRFCLASLVLYAPFLRSIFLVTDDQCPEFLPQVFDRYPSLRKKLRVVDHRLLFRGFEDRLPTFNSIAIEAMMHRIPDLAEHFLYLNDDFFLTRPVEALHFFDADGSPVLRGDWKRYYEDRPSFMIKKALDWRGKRSSRPGFISSQQRAARLAWTGSRYLQVGHVPHPLRRSTLERVYAQHPELLDVQLRHRFRHAEQFSSVSLANHTELGGGTAVVTAMGEVGYLKPNLISQAALRSFATGLENRRFDYACVQSMDDMSDASRRDLLAILDAHYFGVDTARSLAAH